MVLERAEIAIKPGVMEEFLEAFRVQALPLTATFTGCLSFRAFKGVEHPDHVMLLAEWTSLEAHLASHPEPAHARFREIVLPYVDHPIGTVHFEPI
jgi:quinol monooxygenase YgiN